MLFRSPAPAVEADRVGRFDERPLEIPVHVGAKRPEAGLAAAGMDPRRGPGIAGELLGLKVLTEAKNQLDHHLGALEDWN